MSPGLIPAHAGKTIHSTNRADSCGAHPRSRGENGVCSVALSQLVGSSPLTRGKHQTDRVGIHSRGLIPAHAGKTPTRRPSSRCSWAHPRSRGENRRTAACPRICWGSSPLTRGKQAPPPPCRVQEGLIPAHAGKTSRGTGGRLHRRAHPRSRGENRDLDDNMRTALGSSPLTRGKPSIHGPHRAQEGLIPAHAGKTRTRPDQP